MLPGGQLDPVVVLAEPPAVVGGQDNGSVVGQTHVVKGIEQHAKQRVAEGGSGVCFREGGDGCEGAAWIEGGWPLQNAQ